MSIFGIVNITEDSFSDGGLYLDINRAIAHAFELAVGGADVIDLGAASSNPNSATISAEEEISRLRPVIAALKAQDIAVSVDTFKPEVQRFCMEQRVDFINDIQGFPFSELYPELARASCKLVVMHSVQRIGMATVVETEPEEVFHSMMSFFDERITALTDAGIARERLILDPGMGFFLGSNPESSMIALRRFDEIKQRFDLPVMIGVSRKSFLGKMTASDVTDRLAATLVAELFAYKKGADYIRTHDVKPLVDGIRVFDSLYNTSLVE
ncbi:MAG: dihydropteroate synthase [Prevotellaceae bacterium]|jgi:dihydropteroate synthase type 2/dihydropteroate synthase type 3|nr:dihydropteroate synthase [Prevotellaceae bacterium]